jgi:uncharacterized membrane protein
MSMVGTAATREGWPRSRILPAVLAVSLVLNVLFVAGAVWGRIEEAPARGLDRRFERIGAQLALDATQRAAFDRLLAELRGRGDKVQQQVAPLYRAAWDAAGNPTAGADEVFRLFDAAFDKRRQLNRETTRETLDFLATLSPEQRGRFVALARERGSWRK